MGFRPRARIAALAVGAFILLGGVAGVGLMYSGWYSVAATEQHLRPTFVALDIGLRRSVQHHASGIPVPPLDAPVLRERGLACFKDHCAQCHGAPGLARADFAKGLLPVPSSLSQAAHDWRPEELYWITRYGIKMTGMPAWGYRLDDEALWSIVAFLQLLPELGPPQYGRLAAASKARCGTRETEPGGTAEADPRRGQVAIQQYACTACHRIPGIVGPTSHTGPELSAMGGRKFIAGVLPNNPENMVRWLRSPQSVSPQSAMPDLGLNEADARDIAAYLALLR